MSFETARQVADAVLFEGYVLYPYTASADKNKLRWQFGVLTPEGSESTEPHATHTECLVDPKNDPVDQPLTLDVAVRFLQVQDRSGGGTVPWQEGCLREVEASAPLQLGVTQDLPFEVPGGEEEEEGVLRRRYPLSGTVRVHAERLDGPYGTVRVKIDLANTNPWRAGEDTTREETLQHSLVAAHTLLAVRGGAFLSLLDPPEWAKPAAESCENLHTYPVLVGDGRDDVLLSSPIILYDYPSVSPESPKDMCDATEIDEILTLRTMALTDEEKAEARATDPRAAEIIDHVDDMPQEMLERLHGTIRYMRDATGKSAGANEGGATDVLHSPEGVPVPPHEAGGSVPWWDPGADASVSPETDSLALPSGLASKGSRVLLRPSTRGTDAQDMFLAGRTGTVQAVFFDVEDAGYLAVTLDDDPAADLHHQHGRYLYFTPDEVELPPSGEPAGGGETPDAAGQDGAGHE